VSYVWERGINTYMYVYSPQQLTVEKMSNKPLTKLKLMTVFNFRNKKNVLATPKLLHHMHIYWPHVYMLLVINLMYVLHNLQLFVYLLLLVDHAYMLYTFFTW